jgi:hypothetical protein
MKITMKELLIKVVMTLIPSWGDAKIEVFLTDDDSSLKAALSLYYPDGM